MIGTEATDSLPASVPTDSGLDAIYAEISRYYTDKVTQFGATPLGVDWTCVPTQQLRFVQLLKLCDFTRSFSLNDLGCGYGALLAYLDWRHAECTVDYTGVDLSAALIAHAHQLWRGRPRVRFAPGHRCSNVADYSIASGIFNVQLEQPLEVWEAFVRSSLAHLHSSSRVGFAVNFMLEPDAGQRARAGLYVTTPSRWASYCAEQFAATTEIIRDYGLREFTLVVRRPKGSI